MTRDPPPLTGVGETAVGMALIRAEENRRPDRLFEDPYADAFVAAAPEAFAKGPAAPEDLALLGTLFTCLTFQGVIRTRFYDDYLLAAAKADCGQVVLLAAGLDTRAFRLPWPSGVHLFELDLPKVLTFKDSVLAERHAVPRCERTVVPVDLRQDWPTRLREAGFESDMPSAGLIEGLLIYLAADEVAHLLSAVAELASPRSQLALDEGNVADASLLNQARAVPSMNQFTSLWRGGLGDDASNWLTRHGWRTETHEYVTLADSHGRSIPAHAAGGIVVAVRGGAQ